MPEQMQEEVFMQVRDTSRLQTTASIFHDATSPAFKRAAAEAANVLGKNIASSMLTRFELPDGVSTIGRTDSMGVKKYMLFDPSSSFYSPECRARTKALANQAGSNEVIQKNFLEFFTMLAFGATDGRGYLPRQCAEVVKDGVYIRMIWRAATAQPLNMRNMGDLRDRRRKLMEEYKVPASFFPESKWWKRMEKEFSSK